MKILFFAYHYKPDGGPAGPLNCMLSESLVKLGHQVTAIAAVPHYPSGYKQAEYRSWKIYRKNENGVNVIRVPIPSLNRESYINRLVQYFFYQLFTTILGYKFDPDVVITTSPSFVFWFPTIIHGFNKGRKTIYSISDVYPDVGIRSGIFSNKLIIKLLTTMEEKFISNAHKVRVLSRSFIDRVIQLGAKKKNISVIYDWVEIDSIKPLPKINSFSKEYNLIDSFNVIYAGNIGHVQNLDFVVDTAFLLEKYSDIKFIFIGEGNAKTKLETKVDLKKLHNVVFMPYQPRERMMEIYGTADIGLVSLQKGTGFGALPSKTFSILSSGTPIIACVDPGSDTWEVVEKSGGGFALPPENSQKLAEVILDIYNNPDKGVSMGLCGRKYVVKYHSPMFAAKKFVDLFI